MSSEQPCLTANYLSHSASAGLLPAAQLLKFIQTNCLSLQVHLNKHVPDDEGMWPSRAKGQPHDFGWFVSYWFYQIWAGICFCIFYPQNHKHYYFKTTKKKMTKHLSEYISGKTLALGKIQMNQWLDMQTTCLFPSSVNTNTSRPTIIIIRHLFTADRLLLDTNIEQIPCSVLVCFTLLIALDLIK